MILLVLWIAFVVIAMICALSPKDWLEKYKDAIGGLLVVIGGLFLAILLLNFMVDEDITRIIQTIFRRT